MADFEIPPLDPQVAAYLERMAAANVPAVYDVTPEEARANMEATIEQFSMPYDPVFEIEDRHTTDGVPVRIIRPFETDEPCACIVFFHGGGWVLGSVDTHEGMARAIAQRAGVIVVSVDYRLAPEHPYPAPVDDCWNATKWVVANAVELGVDPDRIGVAGDSAGGTIAAAVARRARDHGDFYLALQVLLYPVTSAKMNTVSYDMFETGFGLTRKGMEFFWDAYVGSNAFRADPDVSPIEIQDMRRLCPAIVITAEHDVLRDEGEAYAERLHFTGVETEGLRYDGMIHGFLRMPALFARADEALTEIGEMIGQALKVVRPPAPPAPF
jgi:acetyl esterase